MKIAVIPARGGSKRIPRKNIKEFCGKPIIAYSIEAAVKSGCFDKVVVSTDDIEIAEVAKSYGAEVPFLRPSDLSGDYTPTNEVVIHAIEYFASQSINIDKVLCLYATVPFISAQTIKDSLKVFGNNKSDFCLAVTVFPSPIQRALKIEPDNHLSFYYPEYLNTRSQDLEASYHDAGQFLWGRGCAFKDLSPINSSNTIPYILPNYLVQDIDEPQDWKRAELMYQALLKNGDIN